MYPTGQFKAIAAGRGRRGGRFDAARPAAGAQAAGDTGLAGIWPAGTEPRRVVLELKAAVRWGRCGGGAARGG